jgi:hypothetical protein
MPDIPPPPGYVLDTPSSTPPLPPGYTLDQPPAPSASFSPTPASGGLGFWDALVAGMQRTSPQVSTMRGESNYTPAPPGEQWIFKETGVPSDQQKYVALRGPSGDYQVYYRSPEMAEGPLPALGRALSLAVPETGIPAVGLSAAPGAAQNLMQDFSQLGVTPSIPAVGQSPVTGLVSNMASRFPFSSPVIRQA